MSDETTLLPCPWCSEYPKLAEDGGSTGPWFCVWHDCPPVEGGKARHYGESLGCISITTAWFHTEAEAIAAWNTRASNHHPYEQRITGDGYDWGEIMRDAYDSLMASACESCTPEQMGRLSDYIRAELGGGTLTAEQVREVIQENITFYEGGDYDAQTIADELNAELGSGMCEVESSHYFDEYGCWSVELSCGHTFDWHDSEPPAHCPDCGAKIAKVVEKCTS